MRPIDADVLEKTLRDWIRDHLTGAFTGDDVGAEFADMIEHAETIDMAIKAFDKAIKALEQEIECIEEEPSALDRRKK